MIRLGDCIFRSKILLSTGKHGRIAQSSYCNFDRAAREADFGHPSRPLPVKCGMCNGCEIPSHTTTYDHTAMTKFFHPPLALIASASTRRNWHSTSKLKDEKNILRARPPSQVYTKAYERERPLKLVKRPSTARYRWVREQCNGQAWERSSVEGSLVPNYRLSCAAPQNPRQKWTAAHTIALRHCLLKLTSNAPPDRTPEKMFPCLAWIARPTAPPQRFHQKRRGRPPRPENGDPRG